jgi:hypothetical protein
MLHMEVALGLGLGMVGEQPHGRAIEADDDRPFGGVGSGFSGHGRLRGRVASSSPGRLGDVWRFAHDGAQVTSLRAALLPASGMHGPDRTENA